MPNKITKSSIDIHSFKDAAIKAIIEASKVLWKYFGNEDQNVVRKSDDTLQTIADRESEKIILEHLNPFHENCTVHSEETGINENKNSKYTIVIDPLDGTSNFYRARSEFGMCIALIEYSESFPEIKLSIVYEPSSKRLWSAIKNEGCYLEEIGTNKSKKINVSNLSPEKGDICFDASTNPKDTFKSKADKNIAITEAINYFKRFRMLGSNVLAHALVANGSFEAAVTDTVGGPYDIAPILLVEESGGIATNLYGEKVNIFKDKVVVTSNGVNHNILIDKLLSAYKNLKL